MKYLLDTNIIINHLRGQQSIKIEWIKEGCGLSIISLVELYYGAYKSSKTKKNLKKIKEMLVDLEIEIINLDKKSAIKYGKIKAQLEKEGQKLDDFDLLIAASAISSNLILVTKNKSHFQRIPQLKIIDN